MSENNQTLLEQIRERITNQSYIKSLIDITKNKQNYLVLIVCIAVILIAKSLVVSMAIYMCEEDMVVFTGMVPDVDDIVLALGHQWDSNHFVNIATNWYPSGVENDIVFAFAPLYPYMISVVSNYVENYYMAGLIVSNVFYFMSLIAFYFVARQYMNQTSSYLATTFFATFPPYLVYGTVAYTEPVALFFAITSWFFFKRENYHIASLLITLAIFTRYVFVMVVPVYGLIILSRSIRKYKSHEPARNLIDFRILWLLIPTISTILLFKYFESLTGNFFVAFDSHVFFADSMKTPIDQFDWFFTGFYTELNNLNPIRLLLERYVFTIPFAILIISLFRDKKELGIYGIALMWLTMSMVGISGIAAPRVMLSSWVALLALGENTSPSIYAVAIGLSIVSGLWIMFRFLTGFYA